MGLSDDLRFIKKELSAMPSPAPPPCRCESASIIVDDANRCVCGVCGGRVSEEDAETAMFPPGAIPDEPDSLDELLPGL